MTTDITTDENRAVVARFFDEVLGQRRIEAIDELTGPDYVFRATHIPVAMDAGGHRAFVRQVWAAFPDLRETVVEMVAEGDRVVTRLQGEGTHAGAFAGIPATGRRVVFTSVNIDRVAGGRIRERWLLTDGLGVLTQLGVIPPLPVE